MPNIIDILARALSLRQETALNSITPNRAGGIMYDTLLVLNQMQLEGGSLLISKVYASVSAMEADTTPTSDLTGRALKPGQLVVIVTSDSSSSDMGSEYRFNGPGSWTYVGKVGGLPLDTVPTQSSTKGITSGGVYTALSAMKAEGYKYMGLATPGSGGTAPGTPNQPVFYIAGPGSYPNFGSITVASGYLGFIKYSSGSWTVESVAVGKDYDSQISALDEQISQLEADVDALTDAFAEPGSGEIAVAGFTDYSGNGSTNSQFVQIFKPVFDVDTPINKLKIRVNQKTENGSFSIKLASVKVESNNAVVTTDVSNEVVVTPGLPVGTIADVVVQLPTPFTVKEGERFVVAVSDNGWLRLGNPEVDNGTLCAINAYYTGVSFSTFVAGVRVSSNISYLNFDNYLVLILPYTAGGISIKDIPTREEMEQAIQDAVDVVDETTDELSQRLGTVNSRVDAINRSLKDSAVVSKYKTELCAHNGSIIDGGDGCFYVGYYGSDETMYESIGNNFKCRLSRVSQYNLAEVETVDILKKEDVIGTFVQSSVYSPYDPNLRLINQNTIRYFLVITPDGGLPGIGYRDVTIPEMTTGNSVNYISIKYTINGTTYTEQATHENLGKMIDRYFGQASGGTTGLFPIFSAPFVVINGAIYGYLTGLDAGKNSTDKDWAGVLVKSEDNGSTWEVVAWGNDLFTPRVDFPVWEAGLSLLDGKMYVLFKSMDTPIAYYDLQNNSWSNLVYLFGYYGQGPYADNSKPCLYQVNGKLYAMQNVLPRLVTSNGEVFRSKVGIYRLTPVTMEKEAYFEIINDTGCQYFSIINQKGRLYMCFTEDKSHRNYQMKGDISIIPIDFLPMPEYTE